MNERAMHLLIWFKSLTITDGGRIGGDRSWVLFLVLHVFFVKDACLFFCYPPSVADGIDADIIFLHCGFFFLLSSFSSPILSSAVADWMSTILPHTSVH